MPSPGMSFRGIDLGAGTYEILTRGNVSNANALVKSALGKPLNPDEQKTVDAWEKVNKKLVNSARRNIINAPPEEDEIEEDESATQGRAEGGLIEAEGYADGGEVCSHCGRKNYEDGGEVEGPGTGTSDSVKARLSDGEFVFTAKAVQLIGADNLMKVMKEAERQYDERSSLSKARSLFGKFIQE